MKAGPAALEAARATTGSGAPAGSNGGGALVGGSTRRGEGRTGFTEAAPQPEAPASVPFQEAAPTELEVAEAHTEAAPFEEAAMTCWRRYRQQ